MTIQENSQDWDCFSGIVAKTDLGTEGTQRLSLYTGGNVLIINSMSQRSCTVSELSGASVSELSKYQ
jgi:hypothetical protein